MTVYLSQKSPIEMQGLFTTHCVAVHMCFGYTNKERVPILEMCSNQTRTRLFLLHSKVALVSLKTIDGASTLLA